MAGHEPGGEPKDEGFVAIPPDEPKREITEEIGFTGTMGDIYRKMYPDGDGPTPLLDAFKAGLREPKSPPADGRINKSPDGVPDLVKKIRFPRIGHVDEYGSRYSDEEPRVNILYKKLPYGIAPNLLHNTPDEPGDETNHLTGREPVDNELQEKVLGGLTIELSPGERTIHSSWRPRTNKELPPLKRYPIETSAADWHHPLREHAEELPVAVFPKPTDVSPTTQEEHPVDPPEATPPEAS